jgi:hypothetical protein
MALPSTLASSENSLVHIYVFGKYSYDWTHRNLQRISLRRGQRMVSRQKLGPEQDASVFLILLH